MLNKLITLSSSCDLKIHSSDKEEMLIKVKTQFILIFFVQILHRSIKGNSILHNLCRKSEKSLFTLCTSFEQYFSQ